MLFRSVEERVEVVRRSVSERLARDSHQVLVLSHSVISPARKRGLFLFLFLILFLFLMYRTFG